MALVFDPSCIDLHAFDLTPAQSGRTSPQGEVI